MTSIRSHVRFHHWGWCGISQWPLGNSCVPHPELSSYTCSSAPWDQNTGQWDSGSASFKSGNQRRNKFLGGSLVLFWTLVATFNSVAMSAYLGLSALCVWSFLLLPYMKQEDRVPGNAGYKRKESTSVITDGPQGSRRQLIAPVLPVQALPAVAEAGGAQLVSTGTRIPENKANASLFPSRLLNGLVVLQFSLTLNVTVLFIGKNIPFWLNTCVSGMVHSVSLLLSR